MKIFKGESGKEYRVLFSFNAIVNFEETTRVKLSKIEEVPSSSKLILQFFRFALESGEGKKFTEKEAGKAIDDIMKVTSWIEFVTKLFEAFRSAFGVDVDKTDKSETDEGNGEN